MLSLINANDLRGCTYAEAFCGGAGLAMKLLLKGDVLKVVLNDSDPAVFSIWNNILNYPDDLCDYIESTPLDMGEWYRCRDVYQESAYPSLELGKAALFLNRTNRSGILRDGVIGGKSQAGAYKIDARFNRKSLCKKVRTISARSNDIVLYNLDVLRFIDTIASKLSKYSLLYLDPPYVQKGPGLYENSFTEDDHRILAEHIRRYNNKWMVTYDTDALVDQLYCPSDDWAITTGEINVGYSAANSRYTASERLVLGPDMKLPAM